MEMEFHRWGVEEFITTGSLREPPACMQPPARFLRLMNNQKLLMRHVITQLAQCPGKVGLLPANTPGAAKGVSGLFCSSEWGPSIGEEGRLMCKLLIRLL